MKKLIVILLFPLSVAGIFLSCKVLSIKGSTKDEVTLQIMEAGLSSAHFNPRVINDSLSNQVFTMYLDRLDASKKFLLQSDLAELATHKNKIDDQISGGKFDFFNQSLEIINKRIKECEGYYKEILAQPFDFNQTEFIETDPDKMVFAANSNELKETWRKYLKYQTLLRLDEMMDSQEKAKAKKDTAFTEKPLAKLEEEARKKVTKSNEDLFKRLYKFQRKDRFAAYLASISNCYDPHTEYFAPAEKENFDISMSGQLEGIGAQLQERDGLIKVSTIVPGSASWRQGQLKAGDIILKVAQGRQEPVDISDMRLDEAVKLIRGKKGTEVRLTVKKVDGTTLVIPIVRDIVVMEETYAQSAILERNKKIGYIRLPIFYTDFGKNGARTCADDVKKELEKLKNENVQGVILDLRENGGGSLQDVVQMTGLFIPKGPIVQVKQRFSAANVLQDRDPSVQYDGPLVVMVDENSASASEILAAAIQDYGRGVIIGSNTTFGKGTVQQFINLDEYLLPQLDSLKPLGSVKLSVQKFYRVNGGATQLKGVTPDIILPDVLRYIKYGEKELDYPMPWDEIPAAKYEKWSASAVDITSIKAKSEQRVKGNRLFNMIDEEAHAYKEQRDKSSVSLNLVNYRDYSKKQEQRFKKYEEITKEITDLQVYNLNADKAAIATDTVKVTKNKDWLKNLKKDIYLDEAVAVITDLTKASVGFNGK